MSRRLALSSDSYLLVPTPLGYVGLAWSAIGLRSVTFPLRDAPTAKKAILERRPTARPAERVPGWVRKLVKHFEKELSGQADSGFDREGVPLDLSETPPFHERVYREALKIGRGETLSYGQLADKAGSPAAARAVGQAMAKNPLPLLIPCHRVLASGGKVGGFTAPGGIESKVRLLEMEGRTLKSMKPTKPRTFADGFDEAEVLAFLVSKDRKLGRLIKKIGPFRFVPSKSGAPFHRLMKSIIYQQLHGRAAATIHSRVRDLFEGRDPSPEALLTKFEKDEASLANAGLSRNKRLAIRDLAIAAIEGRVPDRRKMARMSDEEIIEALIPIRGIGRWTVEMMLMFDLGRVDVFAYDDFALRKATMALHGCPEKLDRKGFQAITEKWHPWRSVASWYLWRSLDPKP